MRPRVEERRRPSRFFFASSAMSRKPRPTDGSSGAGGCSVCLRDRIERRIQENDKRNLRGGCFFTSVLYMTGFRERGLTFLNLMEML